MSKVAVTPKCNTFPSHDESTHCNWNSYPKNVGDIIRTRLFKVKGQGQQSYIDPYMVCDFLPSQNPPTHQILDSYLK